MLLTLATVIILNQNKIGDQNVNLDSHNHSFTTGLSLTQREQAKSLLDEQIRRELEKTTARERSAKASRGDSYTGNGRDIQIVGTSKEQCVIYYKRIKGISRSIGYAKYIQPQGQEAEIGAGALENRHISLVIAVYDKEIRVRESNYWYGFITERTIPKEQIRGYIYD